MSIKKTFHGLMALLFLGCSGNKTFDNDTSKYPLSATYQYFDEIDKANYHFLDLDKKLDVARGKNKSDEIASIVKQFESAQSGCIKELEEKFPSGSVQIPFEQTSSKDTVRVKSIYLSGFTFAWNTASNLSVYFTVEYDINKGEFWYATITLTMLDSDGDVLCVLNEPVNSAGKTKFSVMGQATFRKFSRILVN